MIIPCLYQAIFWDLVISIRHAYVALRMIEIAFISFRFLFFRAPLLIVWTRLPVLKGTKKPYGELATIMGPEQQRQILRIHEARDLTLGDITSKEQLADYVRTARQQSDHSRSLPEQIAGRIVRGWLMQLGLCYVKIGVILSMRTDIPDFIREELRYLQVGTPPMSPKCVNKQIKREFDELHRDIRDVFEWVDLTPLACGALAQVHRAKLRTGDMVALKLQRPYVQAVVDIDTYIIKHVVVPFLWTVFRGTRKMEPTIIADYLSGSMVAECDFYGEACVQEEFIKHLRENTLYAQTIKVPKVHLDMCTKKLIVMELMENIHPLDEILEMDTDKLWDALTMKVPQYPEDMSVHIFRVMASVWGDMILNWGVVHADPHLGNMFLMEPQDGYGWRICVCDFGMVQEIPYHLKEWLRDWFRAVMWLRDPEEFIRVTMRDIEPTRILHDLHWTFPRIVKSRYSDSVSREMIRLILPPDAESHATQPREFLRERWIRQQDGSEVPFIMSLRPAAGRTTADDALEIIERFTIGFHADTILTKGHWAVFKTIMYIEALLYTLCKNASWNDIFMHALKQALKEELKYDIERCNADSIRDCLTEVHDLLERPSKMLEIGRRPIP